MLQNYQPSPAAEPVGLGQRILAAMIDTGIVITAIFVLATVLIAIDGGNAEAGTVTTANVIISCLMWLVLLGYPLVMEATRGGTVGKLLLGMQVRKMDGRPAGWGGAALRMVCWIVDGFPYVLPGGVAMLLIGTSPLRQRLGDRVAGTVVVRKDATLTATPGERF